MSLDKRVEAINLKTRPVLLYDADCGICSWLMGLAEQLDSHGCVQVLPFQQFPESEKIRFGLSEERFQQGMYWVGTSSNQSKCLMVAHGAFAANSFFASLPGYRWLIVLLYTIPVLLWVEIIIYNWVAANRNRLSRWLHLNQCKL